MIVRNSLYLNHRIIVFTTFPSCQLLTFGRCAHYLLTSLTNRTTCCSQLSCLICALFLSKLRTISNTADNSTLIKRIRQLPLTRTIIRLSHHGIQLTHLYYILEVLRHLLRLIWLIIIPVYQRRLSY